VNFEKNNTTQIAKIRQARPRAFGENKNNIKNSPACIDHSGGPKKNKIKACGFSLKKTFWYI
jgi:hypothetical protein